MNRAVLLLVLLATFSSLVESQTSISSSDLQKILPVDSAITVGKLENGLTYYIKPNRKPEKRAELRLVVKAGSILEEDNQRGLAHFCEHMAFNGTLNFKKNELVNYLESIGMRFGADVNAYTSFDETVYMLEIPTDTPAIVDKSFDILEDWAHLVSFDDDEIEKERGVVIEEWRLGLGAASRMRDKQFPILFKDSRYAERLPIGQKSILDSFRHETLRQFYRTWYRPDLMAVVAVGDFDKPAIEKLIKKHFSGIESPAVRERLYASVPDHAQTLYAIATDSEATLSSVSIHWLQPVDTGRTEQDYRNTLVRGMYNSMLNDRLNELTKKPDPPFLFASSSYGRLVQTKASYALEVGVKDNGLLNGMESLLTEAYRVRQFGFTQSELDRQKKEMLRAIEQAYMERDKTESSSFAAEFIRNFLTTETIPGIAFEYDLYKKYVPTVALDEVNALANAWMREKNCVVLVNAPQKSGVNVPTQEELASVLLDASKQKLEPYTENVAGGALVEAPPKPGSIMGETKIPELGVTQWDLDNGVRVVLKPTDFKNDEVIFSAFSPGGTSLVADSDYIPAITAASIVDEGGLGKFDAIMLQKKLSGKIAGATPFIGEMEEGISGGASPQDLETMFQMIYLYFTAPRADSSAFLAYQSRLHAYLQNRSARPESAFEDTLQVTMGQYSPRRQPWTEKLFDQLNFKKSLAIYRDRFADASDFTFLFVGNFSPDSLKPFVTTYLGSLPGRRRGEMWKDLGIRPPAGVIEKTVKRGIEPKSRVRMVFTGTFIFSQQNRYFLNSLTSAMEIKLREQLREEKGGVYGVGVSASFERDPKEQYTINIGFGCAPERVDELTKLALSVIDSVKRFGIDSMYVQKVKETQRRERETNVKQNRFWLSNLQFYYDLGEDPRMILNYDNLVATLKPMHIQQAAQYFFNMNNYVKVVLMPKE